MSRTIRDLTGQRFGKITALKPLDKRRNKKVVWLCRCDCGKECEIVGSSLTSKNANSCGCLTEKHGMFGTRIYNVWHTMKERCYVKSHINYSNYGGRGIKVCDEWLDFVPFMEWAYANGYDENAPRGKCTLDRIDTNGDYCPSNCRWVSMSIQANNKTDNVYLKYQGITDTLSNHARRVGINPVLAEGRYIKGMELSDVFKVGRVGEVRKVAQYDKKMNLIKIWDSCKSICQETEYKETNLRGCLSGHRKTTYGYIWKYITKEG